MELNAAKQIFWDYACNRFFLDRDGPRAEYLRLGGGDPNKEKEWRNEYIDYWSSRISVVDLKPLSRLRDTKAHEAIPILLKVNDFGDDYSKFWFAFTLNELARSINTKDSEKIKALEKARALWQDILDTPKGIGPIHRREVKKYMLDALNAKNAEEYVSKYAKSKLNEIK
jgi:hypothetical protein